ncbi:MAG TPA: threonine ammonia-lyase, biosynthetic, partial [Gammaproteobacteria bacterium]|nr:threonine ammonia-lyase, biosynthetic [Gammaproteobacteria bacterium]
MFSEYVRKILRARVYDVAVKTPLDYMPRLSERLGHAVHLKREDLQPVFSFKLRGAYNKMVQLTAAERAAGVIASSAGNHAQGVALAAGALKCQAVIVMPRTTPEIKVRAVRRLGARIVLHGDNFDAASAHAQELAVQRGLTMIHPFDDPEVIAGQGTIAMEMLQQHRGSLDAVFIPVGGGGLFAGMASYLRYVQPDIRLIAVEPADAPTLKAACEAGHPVRLEQVGLFADGVAVREIGRQTFPLAREAVDEHVLVSTDEICAAIRDIY